MNRIVTRIGPLAAAIGLALGSGIALAQQQGSDTEQSQSAVGQRSNSNQASRSQQNPGSSQQNQGSSQQNQGSSQQSQASRSGPSSEAAGEAQGIEEVADENSNLSKFVEAVKAAGLDESLTSGTEYTVFAPTNSALEGKDIDSLMQPDKRDDLVALLRAHIVADNVDKDLAQSIGQAKTIDGGTVDVSVEGDKIMVGDAETTASDAIDIGNLHVYALDGVLPSHPGPTQQTDRQASNRQSGERSGLSDFNRSQSDRSEPDTDAGSRSRLE